MIKQGRGGRLVGASSVLGLQAISSTANYCAAKFAIRGLTQSVGASQAVLTISRLFMFIPIAMEVGKHGITANVYAPGKDLSRAAACSHDMISRLDQHTHESMMPVLVVTTNSLLSCFS